jgi:predicted esterase
LQSSGHPTRAVLLIVLAGAAGGCPYVPPETRHPHVSRTEPLTGATYRIYLPSYHRPDRDWPLVVSLHGTEPWDGPTRQILAWKDLAEQHGLIVVAPVLRSTQGILPVVRSLWYKDLARDERVILNTIEDVCQRYKADAGAVLLTGFSSGGYPLYYTALRNPQRFDMVIARDCNSSMDIFRRVELTDGARKLPVLIFWGKDDLQAIRDQSWQAFRFLRENECYATERKEIGGGHLRRPDVAYAAWAKRLPPRHRR